MWHNMCAHKHDCVRTSMHACELEYLSVRIAVLEYAGNIFACARACTPDETCTSAGKHYCLPAEEYVCTCTYPCARTRRFTRVRADARSHTQIELCEHTLICDYITQVCVGRRRLGTQACARASRGLRIDAGGS